MTEPQGRSPVLAKARIYFEMIKFEHSVFALPFAYMGLFLAERGMPRGRLFFWITVAMVSFRSMAMGANRLIDAAIDARNPRTSGRALPAKKLSRPFVWALTLMFFAVFEVSAWILGPLCFKLSVFPLLLAWLYPVMKRFTWLSHALLGIILGIAPYGSWIAARGDFSWVPGLLMIGITAWVAGFDIIYALQDVDFDRREGLFSFPSRFGLEKSLRVTAWLHGVTVVAWAAMGWQAGLGWIYASGLTAVVILLVREHWLIKSFGLKKIQEAFFTLNAIISLGLFAATLTDLWIRRS
ncbi:MAG TPA: UbiA-like polyprenyltransferase [Verrucomicrobiae bacterium]|jgi:4-hydroxybenzoate polyprenyltransferase|nr:UbiA-like polyprenyltransferase [Verrucomicrobiae bacterium]